jgi:hypothetical protein
MASSQNGWPVVEHGDCTDRAVCGAEFPNGWLKGDVDVIFTYLIERLHREVEPIIVGGCWGWFVKEIEGGSSISNHASGTAIDYNAPKHPMGVYNTYSTPAKNKIAEILNYLEGTVRWGGNYSGRPDDMHWEINKSKSAVKAVADKIRRAQEEYDMKLTDKYTISDDTCDALGKPHGTELTVESGYEYMLLHAGRESRAHFTETQERLNEVTAAQAATDAKVDEILALLRTPQV